MPGRIPRTLGLCAAILLPSLCATLVPVDQALAAAGWVSGTVYHDFNGSGTMDGASVPLGAEPGLPGVLVRAYDSTGALVGQATTAANGTYSISIANAATNNVRIEFDTPAGYFPSPTNTTQTPVTGANKSSRPGPIQFTTFPVATVDFAVVSGDIASSIDRIAAVQMSQGATTIAGTDDTIWMTNQTLAGYTPNLARKSETGALWGLAWNRSTQRLWSSAVIRRTAGLGPKGIGGLYMVDTTAGTSNVLASFDLRDYGLVLENVTTSGGTDYEDAERHITGTNRTAYWDVPGYNGVGLEGIGDIDFSKDDDYLYVVNLYERKIHRFAVGGTADAPTLTGRTDFQVPDTYCTAPNIARPWGIEVMEDGTLNVGAVCTSLVSGTAALTARPDLEKGSILRLVPSSATWSEIGTIDFSYFRNTHNAYFGGTAASAAVFRDTTSHWQEWTNDWATIDAIGSNPWNYFDWSQPIISDIETVKGGGLFVGITDRFGFQATEQLGAPDPTQTTSKIWIHQISDSETIYMCKVAATYVQDMNAACKNNADWVRDDLLHVESSLGALAAYDPSITQWVATTFMDAGSAYSAGVAQYNVDSGAVNVGSAEQPNDFVKGAAMGDIEVLTQNVPLSIGNRLWYDTDGDGIQDAGELPVVGATVTLYNSAGTLVGTALTNSNGEYYFASNVSEASTGNGDYSGGGLTAGEAHTIRIDNAANFSTGMLKNYAVTAADRSSSASSLDDEVDSDATLVEGFPRISVPAMDWGETNLSYDIGFAPVVSVGDTVWVDTDRDQVLDVGESGLAGVTVAITKADGSPVYDVSGNLVTSTVTDANGKYVFNNLPTAPVGTYKTSITVPSGYAATTPTFDTSTALTTAGASDLTLDFGIVPTVSVGDRVWFDANIDGIQNGSDYGIAGVTVRITKSDGTAVTDVFGNAVTTTVTDANGNYTFANLPYGTYKVNVVTAPSGLVSTLTGQGTSATDSTTGIATSAALSTPGASDTTLDFGYYAPVVSVGNKVWFDTNRDGIQDGGEPGIAGVTLTIAKSDGTAVTDVYGNSVTSTVTDANGNYSFTNLPYGSYKVTATSPAGMTATLNGVGSDGAVDSGSAGNSLEATSRNMTTALDSDTTLDFGFFSPKVSVGNLVWFDTNNNGLQEVGEGGLSGVVVSITKADGTAVTDVYGNSVTSTVTDANGNYLFDNLPLGQYKVTAVTPAGMTATLATQGTDRSVDSTTGTATSADLQVDGVPDLTLDFGFWAPPAVVGSRVWSDLDGDGIQDAGESGIAGVTLTITKADGSPVTDVNGNPVTTTVTDADGNYLFKDLPLNTTYKVTVSDPTGYVRSPAGAGADRAVDSSSGFATSTLMTPSNLSDFTLDFGFVPKVSVGDLVWLDTDRDGIKDSGEPGIAGVTLSITKADGTAVTDVNGNSVTTTVTDASGNYSFTNLPPGSYKVTVTGPAGYSATTAGVGADRALDSSTGSATSTSLTTGGSSDTTLDFGFVLPLVSVGNLVWKDTDRDGIKDAGEPGIAGVTVSITKADGTPVVDAAGRTVTSTVTDVNGNYLFENLPAGQYIVSVATPATLTPTTAGVGTDRSLDSSTLTETSALLSNNGDADLSLDFGFVDLPVTVGNLAWVDEDGDGVQEPGESGLAGVVLSLTDASGNPVNDISGTPVANVTTDANGAYSFTNLPPGTYRVNVVSSPTAYTPTVAGAGSDRTVDSSTGNATTAALAGGASDTTLDFGFILTAVKVGNLVWIDADRDGVQDGAESGLAGVTLTITTAAGGPVTDVFGSPVTTTVTDANGNYLFENLPYGSYKVTATTPAGYIATLSQAGSDRGADSSTAFEVSSNLTTALASDLSLDFGFVRPSVSVGNLVWFDSDRDGVQDVGEPGIVGVTLSITKADGSAVTDILGNAVTTTITDSSGNYLFGNLPVGSYKVTVSDPAGYTATVSGAGTTSTDSSTGNVTSLNLTTDGASDLTLDFGYYAPKVSVGNLVWFDANRDGVQNPGEAGIAGVTLAITKLDGTPVVNVFGTEVAPLTTDGSGRFLFDNLPPGQYKVTITNPSGFTATATGAGTGATDSAAGSDTSANLVNDGDSDMTLDFGFFPTSVSVGDFVWLDADKDGVQDADEKGIAGVTLSIMKADGSAVTDVNGVSVTTTVTDANGKYLFANLPPGAYKVSVVTPAGMVSTVAGQGAAATDSATGSATSSDLANNGDSDLTLDFGFIVPVVSVGDFVWLDADGDGVQDAKEKGIAGVTLSITKADGSAVTDVFGNAITTTVTDTNGRYSFANLPVGTYKVRVIPPSGYSATKTGAGAVSSDSSKGDATSTDLTVDGSSDPTLDFGFVKDSDPITPPRKASTKPQTAYGFKTSDLGKPSDGAKFVPSKTVIAGAGSTGWSKGVSANSGTWSVVNGKVMFDPAPGFIGTATVKYQVTDTAGKVAESTLTITVTEDAQMPVTGASPWLLALISLLFLLVGAFLVLRCRRREPIGRVRFSELADKSTRKRSRRGLKTVVAFSVALGLLSFGGGRAAKAAAAPIVGTAITSRIELIFGYVLDTTKPPSTSAFTVKSGSSTIAVSAVRYLNTILYLDLASSIYAGDTVTVTYAAPVVDNTLANNALQKSNGEDTVGFIDFAVTNAALPRTTPNAPATPTVVAGEESATVTVAAPSSGRTPTSYTVTASPGGKTCTITGSSGSCSISGLVAGTAYTFTAVATNASGDSPASNSSSAVTVLAKTTTTTTAPAPSNESSSSSSSTSGTTSTTTTSTTISTGTSAVGPSWDIEPLIDSETDTGTVGVMPTSFPASIIITDEFGFTVDAKGGIKPKIRMKNYSGRLSMKLAATYVDGGKTKKYACRFAAFGTKKKISAAKWRWYTPKKACVLPKALVDAVRTGSTSIAASGKWSRVWSTTAQRKRPDGSVIAARKLNYVVRARK